MKNTRGDWLVKKTIWFSLGIAVVAATIVLSGVRSAKAIPEFRKEFVAKYVKADSKAAKDKAFAEAVDKARCNLCHAGTDKQTRNVYGQAIGKFISEEDREDRAKIRAALEKAARVKSKSDDPKSPTFGERISSGKLPCEVVK